MSEAKQIVLQLAVPQNVVDKVRPSKGTTFKIDADVFVMWGQPLRLPFFAHLWSCASGHSFVVYQHDNEPVVEIRPCSKCGADAEDLTNMWRWEYHSDYTACRGCGQGFSFQKKRKTCVSTCPYEKIKYRRSGDDD